MLQELEYGNRSTYMDCEKWCHGCMIKKRCHVLQKAFPTRPKIERPGSRKKEYIPPESDIEKDLSTLHSLNDSTLLHQQQHVIDHFDHILDTLPPNVLSLLTNSQSDFSQHLRDNGINISDMWKTLDEDTREKLILLLPTTDRNYLLKCGHRNGPSDKIDSIYNENVIGSDKCNKEGPLSNSHLLRSGKRLTVGVFKKDNSSKDV